MSRSAETSGRRRTHAVGGLVVGTLAATLLGTAPASAETEHVYRLVPHVYDLRSHSQDLGGTATVTASPRTIDMVLNSNVLFGKDSATIQPAARARIAALAQQLSAAGAGRLTITGYTDDLGSSEHGLVLSRQRAAAVRSALGPLPGTTVTVTGKGEADPVAPNTDEASRSRNRRVEMHWTKAA